MSTATATVAAGANPVSGDTVTFSSSDSAEKIGPVTDNKNGTYTATITSSKTVGSATITAVDGSVSPGVSGQATLTQTAGSGVECGRAAFARFDRGERDLDEHRNRDRGRRR